MSEPAKVIGPKQPTAQIPADGSPANELTPRVFVLGILLAIIMGAANVYVGLKAGMTVSASIPAAVMSMLLFRWLFKNSSILESNQVQTCASAGESLAAGIIFTMPAMILIGYWKSFDFWTVTIVAATGGLLGILFMIPMRRVFVVDNQDLAYPEGVACAAVLKAGAEGKTSGGEASGLVIGGLTGVVFTILAKFFSLISPSLEVATTIGSRVFFFGSDLSPMLIAVGFIVRLNVAILIFIGGAGAWLVGIPLLGGADPTADSIDSAYDIWSTKVRYIGVGAMVVGGFSSLVTVRAGLFAAVRELSRGLQKGTLGTVPSQRDLPSWAILLVGLICTGLLAGVNYHFAGGVGMAALSTVVMMVMSFFFCAVACHIVGLVGNSNSPVSGMTITAVLVTGGMLWLFGYSGMNAMVATLGIAAVVCCVACTSGDVCNDLKTGSMVGAAPFRQQIMQIIGVVVASVVMAPVLNLLHEQADGGIGGKELSAPQASLFKSLVMGFSGESVLPWDLIAIGAAVGVAILVIDHGLKVFRVGFRAYLMPIAVGMYLPFGLAIPILIGGLIAHFYTRKTIAIEHDRRLQKGVLFSSGVIAGEALTAVGLAGLAAFQIMGMPAELSAQTKTSISLLAAVIVIALFIVVSKPRQESPSNFESGGK